MCNKKYVKIYKKYVIHYTDHVAECALLHVQLSDMYDTAAEVQLFISV